MNHPLFVTAFAPGPACGGQASHGRHIMVPLWLVRARLGAKGVNLGVNQGLQPYAVTRTLPVIVTDGRREAVRAACSLCEA